jgi:hypothetical protein
VHTRPASDYDDHTIAVILAQQKRRTAIGLTWTRPRVATPAGQLRSAHPPPPPTADVRSDCDDSVVGPGGDPLLLLDHQVQIEQLP